MAIAFIKTPAICINVRPFSKTSHMVTWLTPKYGRITTPIKGAQRPKSAFLGKYDIGYTCEIVLYVHERNGIHNIRECHPIVFREELHASWRSGISANYACDLAMRAAHPHLPAEQLFEILSDLLDHLPALARHEHALTLLWFESRLLTAIGIAPDFKHCPLCTTTQPTFSIEDGRFYCEHRPSRLTNPPSLTLYHDIPDLFLLFQTFSVETLLQASQTSTRKDDLGRPEPFPGIFGLRRFLGIFITRHLEIAPGPRRTLLETII